MTDEELRQLPALEYYKWHWQRFRANRRVQRMDYIARGLYRELLDEQWVDGSISADLAELADICGCPVQVMQEKWPQLAGCFNVDEASGRLFNQTLEDQRTALDAKRIKLSKNGSSGGKQKLFNAKLNGSIDNQLPTIAKQLPSNCHIEEKSREEKSRDLKACSSENPDERVDDPKKDAEDKKKAEQEIAKAQRLKKLAAMAERCHAAYPRKIAKQDSLRAFIKHITKLAQSEKISDDEAGARMLARVEEYAGSPLVASTPADKIPYPATWANAGQYEDPREAWQVTTEIQLRGNGYAGSGNRAQDRTNGNLAAARAAIESFASADAGGFGGSAAGSYEHGNV